MSGLHVPAPILWEKWGATPAEVQRWIALAVKLSTDPEWQKVAGEPTTTSERITLTDPNAAPPVPADAGIDGVVRP